MFEARFLATAYRLFALALPGVLVLLTACGGSSTGTPPAPIPDVSGNWAITTIAIASPEDLFDLSGNFTSSGKQVTGAFLARGTCFLPTFSGSTFAEPVLTFSGTIDSSGRLKLVSSAYQNQIVTAAGTVSADGSTLSLGSFSVAGGCADKVAGTLAGNRIPSLTGTFSGSFTLSNLTVPGSTVVSVVMRLTQATAPTGFGYTLSDGTVTITGTPCFSKGSITTPGLGNPFAANAVFGKHFIVSFAMDDGSTLTATGESDLAAAQPRVLFTVNGGQCSGDFISGTFTRQ